MARFASASSSASAASSAQTPTMVAADGTKPAGAVTAGSARMPAPTVLPTDQRRAYGERQRGSGCNQRMCWPHQWYGEVETSWREPP